MRAIVRVLLLLFPRRFRNSFGPAILGHVEDERRTRRVRRLLVIADLLWGAVAERRASLVAAFAPSPARAASGDVVVAPVPGPALKPLDAEGLAVSRRQFLNRAWAVSATTALGLLGMSSLSFLWPRLTGGFGTKVPVGDYDQIVAQVGPEGGFKPLFVPEGRFYMTYYDGTGDAPVYPLVHATETNLQALYRKCVHLGCSVPHCETSMLFECPCNGSKYRLHGKGPAPRGLDRFPVTIEKGIVVVDTGDLQMGREPTRGRDSPAARGPCASRALSPGRTFRRPVASARRSASPNITY